MSELTSIATLLWPALFVVAMLPVILLVLVQKRSKDQTEKLSAIMCLILLGSLYLIDPINSLIRWSLSIIGFASPLALGIISIRYLVEETSQPF
jgi:hypothetical protein